MFNILLVEPDEAFLATLVGRLGGERDDITVHGVQDDVTAVEILESHEKIDLIITVAHEPEIVDGFQLVLSARELAPESRLIISTSLDAFQMHAISDHSVAHYIPRVTSPDDLFMLAVAVLEGTTEVAGVLNDLELLDIVVMACVSERTATLHVREGPFKGQIVFVGGHITHAQLGELKGEEALFELLTLQQGDIYLKTRVEEGVKTIDEPWLDIIVRGLPSLGERRERRKAMAAGRSDDSITEADVGELLGVRDSSIEIPLLPASDDSGARMLFSKEELLEMGDLEMPQSPSQMQGSLSQHSSSSWLESKDPSSFDQGANPNGRPGLGLSGAQPSGRRFARQHAPPPPPAHRPRMDMSDISTALYDTIERFQLEVPEFLACDIIQQHDGMSIASLSALPDYDSTTSCAYYSDFLNTCAKAVHTFGLPPNVEDIQITTNHHYILMRVIRGTPFAQLVLIGHEGNLGIAKVAMRRFEPLFAQILPH